MGISGLLPLLKSVQKPTHLSELAGKTIAVDAYVWLHRGAYSCASELVTGKYTTRYVDYAMYRVRLLQHYKIIPYLVFDGGPLPAKKGTEVERKRKRDEHLVMANALAQQGKHSEAREHYVKCVDITPQMAFQVIKALRVENVSYIVAPYEADSQLAYLERNGIVDGILTEDSDLLIFGARLVLFKLDTPSATCIAISSDSLASNAPSDLALHGWGITELRACAMLSGCDYLEGVKGVGLKTAGKVMRRCGTIEKALRSLRMDGKHVERDWEKRMRTAEAAFLHQRVWDPRTEMIVYLTDPDMAVWDEERERFVGRHLEPDIAGRLARGDFDPVTLEPMVDIMPSFQPGNQPRPRPLAFKDPNRRVTLPSADDPKSQNGPLFQYFAKKSKPAAFTPISISTRPLLPTSAPARTTMHLGGASGKRTLAEQYDREADTPTKRPKLAIESDLVHCSKFFMPPSPSHCQGRFDDDKENLEELEDLELVEETDLEVDPVKQEDGYISPSPAFSSPGDKKGITPDFSSPLQDRSPVMHRGEDSNPTTPRRTTDRIKSENAEVVDHDLTYNASDDGRITSPPSASRQTPIIRVRKAPSKVTLITMDDLQPEANPQSHAPDVFAGGRLSVDLRDLFSESPGSKIADTIQFTPGANCSLGGGSNMQVETECGEEDDIESSRQIEERHRIVGAGWEKRYASASRRPGRPVAKARVKECLRPVLHRRETMATPLGEAQRPVTQRKPRPRHSDPVGAISPEWIPPVRTRLPVGEDNVMDDSISAWPSSQDAVVDDAGESPASKTRRRLHEYRFS